MFSAWCFPPRTFSIAAFPPRRISVVNTCACRELSFKKGDAVNIIRQIDNNWYEGEFRGRVGIFPMSYVEVGGPYCACESFSRLSAEGRFLTSSFFLTHKQKMPSTEKQQPVRPPPPAQVRDIGEAVARYNFNADTNVELSLRKVAAAENPELMNQSFCITGKNGGGVFFLFLCSG